MTIGTAGKDAAQLDEERESVVVAELQIEQGEVEVGRRLQASRARTAFGAHVTLTSCASLRTTTSKAERIRG